MIRKLHHNAYRCRDSEETRAFYEDFLGLPLVGTLEIGESKTGRATQTLHTFYRLDDGSHLAFFECRELPFEFKKQHDFDLHIALEVAPEVLEPMLAKGRARNIEVRGPSDHGMIDSIYFRDPNGYVIELTAKHGDHERAMDPSVNRARQELDSWQTDKPRAARKPPPGASARRRPRAKGRPKPRRT
jgi:catechol 2,3-dioxygenase-like lactoylglutathione lyase family enzyme